MQFHDFSPCRAPKMKPSRRRILIADFCFKTPARINIPPFQTTSTHQNHSQHTVKSSKIAHPKIMRIHWSEYPSTAPTSSFTKHQSNPAKINNSFIIGTSNTSTCSISHRFYTVFWKSNFGNHLTVSGDPKSASRPILATLLRRYKNNGLDTHSTS